MAANAQNAIPAQLMKMQASFQRLTVFKRLALSFGASLTLAYLILGYMIRRKERKLTAKAPKGDMGGYFFGQMVNFLSVEEFDKRMIKEHGLNHLIHLFFKPNVRIGTVEDRAMISRSEAKGMSVVAWPSHFNALMGPDAMTVVTDERHAFLRKFFYSVFSPEVLRSYVNTTDRCISEFLDKMARNPDMIQDSEQFKILSLSILVKTAFQGSATDEEVRHLSSLFLIWVGGLGVLVPLDLPFTAYRAALDARKQILDLIRRLTNRCRESFTESERGGVPEEGEVNLLKKVVRYRDERGVGLTEEEICDNLLVILFAGNETTASVFGTFVGLLFKPSNRHILDKLRLEASKYDQVGDDGLKHASYICAVVDETLRAFPPINGFFRRATQDIPLSDGTVVPKGLDMSVYVTAGHCEKSVWGENLEFDPDRMIRIRAEHPDAMRTHFLPFGAGNRVCVGEPLARLELRVFLYRLAQRYEATIVKSSHEFIPVNKIWCKFKLRPLKDEDAATRRLP